MPLNSDFSSARIAQAHDPKIAPSFEQLLLQLLCKDQRELFHKGPFFVTLWNGFPKKLNPIFQAEMKFQITTNPEAIA